MGATSARITPRGDSRGFLIVGDLADADTLDRRGDPPSGGRDDG